MIFISFLKNWEEAPLGFVNKEANINVIAKGYILTPIFRKITPWIEILNRKFCQYCLILKFHNDVWDHLNQLAVPLKHSLTLSGFFKKSYSEIYENSSKNASSKVHFQCSCQARSFLSIFKKREKHSSMSIFHVFLIVETTPNCTKHHICSPPQKLLIIHSVHPPPPICWGGLSLLLNFQNVGTWQDLRF